MPLTESFLPHVLTRFVHHSGNNYHRVTTVKCEIQTSLYRCCGPEVTTVRYETLSTRLYSRSSTGLVIVTHVKSGSRQNVTFYRGHLQSERIQNMNVIH